MPGKVGIVGSGTIGRGWIILFARAGYSVSVFDSQPGAARDALEQLRPSLVDLEKLGYVDDSDTVLGRVQVAKTLADAANGARYMQESVTEDAEIKAQVFAEMDKYAPAEIPLASSCSSIPPSVFLKNIKGRERCLVAHPFNPPHLMPAVEIVTTPWSDPSVVSRVCEILEEVGQSPAIINKEVPGYVVNRLQAAVVNEAIHLVAEGVISPRDLDRCMRDGIGRRWALMGPFETMELNAPKGFLDYARKFGHSYQALGNELVVDKPWPEETLQHIENWRRSITSIDKIAEQQRWRDRMLLRLRDLVDGQANPTGETES